MTEIAFRRGLGSILARSLAGGMIMAVGIFTLVEGSSYDIGRARAMGPGYFPVALGILLTGLGLAILVMDQMQRSFSIARFDLRPAFAIVAAIGAFALLIEPLGLVLTTMIVVAIASIADPDIRALRVFLLGAGLAVLCSVIFVLTLQLQMELFPW